MRSSDQTIGLVIPCYNEAARLSIEAIQKRPLMLKILFVNDGSTDSTASLLERLSGPGVATLHLSQNFGKAEAIRRGILHLCKDPAYTECAWVGFWDADLSTPLVEAQRFLSYNTTFSPPATAIWGSRIYKLGSRIHRSYIRHLLGRLFSTVVGFLFSEIKVYDSQCGAKLFDRKLAEKIFSGPFLSSWIFDLELAMRLRGEKVVEYPLQEWADVSGSKLKLIRHAFAVACDLIRIRRAYPRQSREASLL